MKKQFAYILTLIAALSLTATLPATARSVRHPHHVSVSKVNSAIHHLEKEVRNASATGTLTKANAKYLRIQIKQAKLMEKDALNSKRPLNGVWNKVRHLSHEFKTLNHGAHSSGHTK